MQLLIEFNKEHCKLLLFGLDGKHPINPDNIFFPVHYYWFWIQNVWHVPLLKLESKTNILLLAQLQNYTFKLLFYVVEKHDLVQVLDLSYYCTLQIAHVPSEF